MCDVDPLDILETIRKVPLARDPDLTVGLVLGSFGGTSTDTPKDTPRDKEGRQ